MANDITQQSRRDELPSSHPTVPFELQEMTIRSFFPDEEVPDSSGLAKCALVCRDWHRLAIRSLYHHIGILGKKQYTLLDGSLRTMESLGHQIHILRISDVTPHEYVSPSILHAPERLPNLEQLFFFGPHDSKPSPFPVRPILFVTLSRFYSVHHIHFHQIHLHSLNELRKIFGALPGLRSAILRGVSWKTTENEQFRPLFNATSWRLSQCSFADCTSNFVAPFFWALPTRLNPNQVPNSTEERHPPLCALGVVPIVELAKFVLNPPESMLGSICWEWAKLEGGNTWCLECCIDEISTDENLTCIRFHLSSHSLTSTQYRVVRIEIYKEDQSEISLDSLGILLTNEDFMFQSLNRIDLNFVKAETNSTLHMIARQLSCIAKAYKGILIYVNGTSCDPSIPTHSLPHATQTSGPGKVCCPRIKDRITTSKTCVLQSLDLLASALDLRGLKGDFVKAKQGAIKIQREFAKADATKYDSLLEELLSRLVDRDTLDGDATEECNREAETLRRYTKEGLSKYIPGLADSLRRVCSALLDLERNSEALEVGLEDVKLRRGLVDQSWGKYTPLVSNPLHGTKIDLSDLTNHIDGHGSLHEEIELRKQIAIRNSSIFTPNFARSLHNVGLSLGRLGRHEEALQSYKEAEHIRRGLVKQNPEKFTRRLADTLHNMGFALEHLGRYDEVLQNYKEAVDIRRELAEQDPIVFTPYLAQSLHSMGFCLRGLGRREEALQIYKEGTDARRILVAQDPVKYTPYLAQSLHGVGFTLRDLGRFEEALEVYQEAEHIRRELVEQYPVKFNPGLADSLHNIAVSLEHLGRFEEALKGYQEARDIRRGLVEQDSVKYAPYLAQSLHGIGFTLGELGRYEEALRILVETVDIRRGLVKQDAVEFSPELARSLRRMGFTLKMVGRNEEAMKSYEEATEIIRRGE